MIRSLIVQLSEQTIEISEELESLYSSCGSGTKQPQIDKLIGVLQSIIKDLDPVYLILDALDESSDTDELMLRIQEMQGWGYRQFHMILMSRRHNDIEKGIEPMTQPEERICIQSALVDADISTYIQERLLSDPKLRRWQGKPRIQEEIRLTLMEKADGMFRWAVCQLDALQDCLSITALRKALRSLPKTLDETYVRILRNIPDEFSDHAVRILEWLTYSTRPIHLHELAEVVAVNPDGNPWFDYDARFAESRELLSVCSSLITIEEVVDTSPSREIEGICRPVLPDLRATESRSTIIDRKQTARGLEIIRKVESIFVVVRLAHFSVKEYLVSDRIRAQLAAKYALQDVQSNRSIAAICLANLLQFDREDALTNDFMQEHPLYKYAAEYWVDHTVIVGQDLGDIRRLCLTFLQVDQLAYRNWKFLTRWPDSERITSSTLDRWWVRTESNPLINMASEGANELVALLLESGADVDTEGGRGSALIAASANGHEETVRLLLDHNANINAAPGRTALGDAAEHGHEAIVRLLLANGADANAQWLDRQFPPFNMGYTPLQAAVWGGKGDTAIVKTLLDHDANANLVFEQGRYATALEAACMFGGREAVIQQLIDAGADVNATVGPLHHSVLQRLLLVRTPPSDGILCLLAHGARTDILSADGLQKLEATKVDHQILLELRATKVNHQILLEIRRYRNQRPRPH